MKKIIAIFAMICMLCVLVACDDNKKKDPTVTGDELPTFPEGEYVETEEIEYPAINPFG